MGGPGLRAFPERRRRLASPVQKRRDRRSDARRRHEGGARARRPRCRGSAAGDRPVRRQAGRRALPAGCRGLRRSHALGGPDRGRADAVRRRAHAGRRPDRDPDFPRRSFPLCRGVGGPLAGLGRCRRRPARAPAVRLGRPGGRCERQRGLPAFVLGESRGANRCRRSLGGAVAARPMGRPADAIGEAPPLHCRESSRLASPRPT